MAPFFDSQRRQKPDTRENIRQFYAALGTVCDPRAVSAMVPERDEVSDIPVGGGRAYSKSLAHRVGWLCRGLVWGTFW